MAMASDNPKRSVSDYIASAAQDKPGSLYASRRKIYPKLAKGQFRRLKWILLVVTLGIYYVVPWIRWNRGPDLPNQAVLLDMEHERFFMFGLEIWPQEFYFVTGLLILASLTLFLVTSLAGRVWCGYFCPQTVWTDLMIAVERFWEGDRNARMKLDASPLLHRFLKRSATHISWLLIALCTGGAFVFYFANAPTLATQLVSGTAPLPAYMFIAILTGTTYMLGGIAREQVCIYMCPWPRIQGAMVDQHSLLVTYRDVRGEPRGKHHKGESWEGRGDCVDCKACVTVCPMGIDIRDGQQLECIQCALCIDACDDIMKKVGRPTGLVAYDTIAGLEAAATGAKSAGLKLLRPRTMLYAALIGLVGTIMLIALANRSVLDLTILPDRNPLYVTLSNGDIRNGYTLKIINKRHERRTFTVEVEGQPNAKVVVDMGDDGSHRVKVAADVMEEVRAYVSSPRGKADNDDLTFIVRDTASGDEIRESTKFRRPAQ